MVDPTNLHAIDDVKFLTGYNVEPVVASETAIENAIEAHDTSMTDLLDESQKTGTDIFATKDDFLQTNLGLGWSLLYEAELDPFVATLDFERDPAFVAGIEAVSGHVFDHLH